MIRWCIVCLSAAALAGCASSPRDDFHAVEQSAEQRGQTVHWNQSTQDDADAAAAVGKLLNQPLSRESAVQIALLNNRSLQATFEDIGIAQADLVQAGLLKNPVFDIDFKFIQGGGKPHIEGDVSEDFLSILQIPLRQKIAETNLHVATLRVSQEVLALSTKTEQAYIDVQAAQQMLELRKTIEQATDASAEAAKQLHAAGNLDDLKLADQQAEHEQAKLDVMSAEADVTLAQENLNALMGLADSPSWKIESRLPEPPASEPGEADLLTQAIAHRPDLAAIHAEADSAARALGVAKLAWLSDAQIGAAAEREHGGSWEAGPAFTLPIPLFDQGQGARGRATAELRRSQQLYVAKVVEIRSVVRADLVRVSAARARVTAYESTLLPLRRRIIDESQRQYNGMFLSVFELLQARQAEIAAGQAYLESLKAYWMARSDLELAIGGTLPTSSVPASQPVTRPADRTKDMKMN